MFDIHFTRFITVAWTTVFWVLLIIAHFLALGYGAFIGVMAIYEANEQHASAMERYEQEMEWYEQERRNPNRWHQPSEPELPEYQGPTWQIPVYSIGYVLVLALSLVFWRMMLEFTIVVFRSEAHLRTAKEHYQRMAKVEKFDEK